MRMDAEKLAVDGSVLKRWKERQERKAGGARKVSGRKKQGKRRSGKREEGWWDRHQINNIRKNIHQSNWSTRVWVGGRGSRVRVMHKVGCE